MPVGTKHFQDSALPVLFAFTEHANFLNITKAELRCPEVCVQLLLQSQALCHSAHRSTWPSLSNELVFSSGGRTSHSSSIQPQNLWCLKQDCLQTRTSGEAGVLGWGTARTRRGMVKKKMSSCTSAPDGLLQRQWCDHQAGSLTGLQLLMKHQCWISERS